MTPEQDDPYIEIVPFVVKVGDTVWIQNGWEHSPSGKRDGVTFAELTRHALWLHLKRVWAFRKQTYGRWRGGRNEILL